MLDDFFKILFFSQLKPEEIMADPIVTPPKAIPIGAVITPANAETPIEPAATLVKFKKWLKPVMT
jgi:hypothetical protein